MSGKSDITIIPEEIVYSLFNFFFDILWNSIYLDYAPKFGWEDLIYNYLFTSQRESHSVPKRNFFLKLIFIASQLELSREGFTKLTYVFYWKILTMPFVLAYQFYFYAPAYRAWLFEKLIFELEVSLYSFKITCILLR